MRESIQSIGQIGLFLIRIVMSLRFSREQMADIARQIYSVGARSLPIIAVGGLFVGLVISLQGYRALETIGAGSALAQAPAKPAPARRIATIVKVEATRGIPNRRNACIGGVNTNARSTASARGANTLPPA